MRFGDIRMDIANAYNYEIGLIHESNYKTFNIDYKEFDIVYFDIPYKGTNKYDFEFDYDRFYDLFKSLKKDLNINAFLSEYEAPFTCVAEFEKTQLMAASVGATKKTSKERLFYNGSPAEYRALMGADYAPKVEQMALF